MRKYPFMFSYLPFMLHDLVLKLPWYSFFILAARRHGRAWRPG